MRRRGRLFRVCKWAMTLLSVALLALFIASGWWELRAYMPIAGQSWEVSVWGGQFYALQFDSSGWIEPLEAELTVTRVWEGWPRLNLHQAISLQAFDVSASSIEMPALWLAMASIVPTGLLWWIDRKRHPPGHCPHCGYDLTGNESGVCPECGRAAEASRAGKKARSASSAAK